jgi:putative restriction endonuclease
MKIYGHIEGIKEGQIFSSRKEVKDAGLHIHTDAGIDGTTTEATCAIVISGGYEDDVDELDYILYTGQGGQNTRRGENITTQIKDQEFTRGNQGLVLSKEYNKPVRVIRGYQTTHGPENGYRYDGLYYVVDYERVKGKKGFYVCRFHLQSESTLDNLELKLKKSLKPSYERTSRTEITTSRINRNTGNSEKIKEMYEYKCQVCNIFLSQPGTKRGISIGAHIKGVGIPNNGPDVIENMLCLCPNHHDQFDKYSFTIDSENMEIIGLAGHSNKKLNVIKKHRIDKDFIDYHNQKYVIKNN